MLSTKSKNDICAMTISRKIIHDLFNDIQDLYADDIAFQVFRKTPAIVPDQITGFLQSWVKEETIKSVDAKRDRWINASTMVHNARAIAQMKRQHVEDTNSVAAKANQKFLAQLPPDMTRRIRLFQDPFGKSEGRDECARVSNLVGRVPQQIPQHSRKELIYHQFPQKVRDFERRLRL